MKHYIDFVATAPAERKGEPIKAEPHKPAGGRMSLVDALQKQVSSALITVQHLLFVGAV